MLEVEKIYSKKELKRRRSVQEQRILSYLFVNAQTYGMCFGLPKHSKRVPLRHLCYIGYRVWKNLSFLDTVCFFCGETLYINTYFYYPIRLLKWCATKWELFSKNSKTKMYDCIWSPCISHRLFDLSILRLIRII